MSVLSDDTDVLLLIPPDFFLIPSDSEDEGGANGIVAEESLIVSDLITQVNDLEGRICLIENRCREETAMVGSQQQQQMRRYGSADALNHSNRSFNYSRSLQGTPIKAGPSSSSSLPSWKCGTFPLEMRENMLTRSEYVARKDKDEQMLREIDQFFTHRNGSDGDGSERERNGFSLTKPEGAQLSAAVFNLNKVTDLLKKLDETQKEIEEKVKLKEITELETEEALNSECTKKEFEEDDKAGADKASEQLKSAKRVLSFERDDGKRDDDDDDDDGNEDDDDGKEKKKKKKNPWMSNAEFHCGEQVGGGSCANARQNAAEEHSRKNLPEVPNLLSLSNLWGSTADVQKQSALANDEQILKQKIQEERCRRHHCEELIQQLQLRLLEEQQRIAVAMKVDEEKDQAIAKLTEGWNKLVGHWRDLESQRNNLAKKLLTDREKFKSEMSAAYQTVKRYEVELSKALDLAHGYKEKCEASEREKKNFFASATKETDALKAELRDATEKLRLEQAKSDKYEKCLSTKDELVNQGKARASELQTQIRDGKKALKELQAELESVKSDRDKATEKLKEERARASAAEQSKKALQHQNEEMKKKEKAMKEDAKLLKEQMEKVKVELKEFYQEQVESIVQEKLKEFQEQLATAEKTLQGEIEMREKTVTEMAVKQVQQHLTKINLLEEKHKEETELWKLQMSQKEEKIKELQRKLEQYSNSKTVIAQKLHSVMEAQWQEALKIIASASPQQVKSPPSSARGESDKSVTRQNTFTMTSSGWGDGNFAKSSSSLTTTTTATSTDTPFCQEGLLTFREELKPGEPLTYRVNETPQKMSSDSLHKYIKALLDRAPGHPTDDDSLESTAYKSVLPPPPPPPLADDSSLARWQHILSEPVLGQVLNDSSKCSSESVKPSKEVKPPWK